MSGLVGIVCLLAKELLKCEFAPARIDRCKCWYQQTIPVFGSGPWILETPGKTFRKEDLPEETSLVWALHNPTFKTTGKVYFVSFVDGSS